MFDSHCHVTDIEQPRAVVQQALSSGVQALLTCGYHAESNAAVLALAATYDRLPFALGLHPWYADEPVEPVLALIERSAPTAIGEAGLDLWPGPSMPALSRQVLVLEAQLDLAERLNLPVTLHSRKAVPELLAVLGNHPRVRGALHAFSGSYEQARPFLDRGWYVGLGGAVTRPRARRLRRLAQALPLDRILLETDAPAIGLEGIEPPHVRPAHLPKVLQAIAELRQMAPEELEAHTDANAERLFGPQLRIRPNPQA